MAASELPQQEVEGLPDTLLHTQLYSSMMLTSYELRDFFTVGCKFKDVSLKKFKNKLTNRNTVKYSSVCIPKMYTFHLKVPLFQFISLSNLENEVKVVLYIICLYLFTCAFSLCWCKYSCIFTCSVIYIDDQLMYLVDCLSLIFLINRIGLTTEPCVVPASICLICDS